jgi:outer membrane protein TolC
LKQKEQAIVLELINSVNRYNMLVDNLQTAKLIVESEEKKLQAEEEKIVQGRSDIDTLVRYQTDLMNAKLMLVELQYAIVEKNIEIDWQQNVLLEKN